MAVPSTEPRRFAIRHAWRWHGPPRVAKLLAQPGVGHAFINQRMEVAVGCPAAQTAQCAPAGLEGFEDFVVEDVFSASA